MSAPVIRQLVAEDLDDLLALYQHLHVSDEPAARGDLERVWGALTADPSYVYLGAFVDGQLVSGCNAAIVPNLTRGARPYAVIENVVTHPAHRGRGLASQTLEALIALCGERSCYKIMLLSAAGRSQAHDLYRKLGFDADAKQAFVLKR